MRELENGRRSLKLKTQIFPLGSVSLVAVAPANLHRPPQTLAARHCYSELNLTTAPVAREP